MTKFKCLFSLLILTNIFMFNAEAGAISNNETIKIFDELCINIESANTRGAKTGFDKIKSVYPDSQMTFEQYAGLDPSRRRQEAKEAAYLEAFQKVAEIPLTPEQANILNKIGAGEPIQKVMEEFQSKYASACISANN